MKQRPKNRPSTARPPAQPNQSLAGGLDCLLHLVSAARPVGSRETARALGMDPTRTNRLLGTLAHLGLAQRTPQRKYVVGPGVHTLAAMSLRGSQLLNRALPVIRRLIRDTRLTVALGVLWRRHVCYLYHGGPDRPVEAAIAGHHLYPAQESIIGKILLAHRDKADTQTVFRQTAPTPKPARDLRAFLKDLEHTRKRGYALSSTSIAVAVGDPPVAGLALAGFRRATPKRIAALADLLRRQAATIA